MELAAGRARPAALAIDLYDPSNRLLGGDTGSGSFGCPRIDGSDPVNFSWAVNTGSSTATYTVCVRNGAEGRSAVEAYVLDVNAAAP